MWLESSATRTVSTLGRTIAVRPGELVWAWPRNGPALAPASEDASDRRAVRVRRPAAGPAAESRLQLGDAGALRTGSEGQAAPTLGHGRAVLGMADRHRGRRLALRRHVPPRPRHGPGVDRGLGTDRDARSCA